MLRKINLVVRKEMLLCVLSAFLLILSFPGFNLEFLAWFAFVPLFFALKGKTKKEAFGLAYFTGAVFWLGAVYWLIHVTLAGMILLVLYLALYFGLFGLAIRSYKLEVMSYELFFIPSLWVLLEYLRSYLLTGFPWALLGYSQYLNLPVIQIADITGAWGVSFLVMMVNVFVYCVLCIVYCVLRKKQKETAFSKINFIPLILLVMSLGYGFYSLRNTPDAIRPTIKVSVIQGNIPQELKWERFSAGFIIDRYLSLTAQAAQDNPDLIIWPEAALPAVLEEETRYISEAADFIKKLKIPLLLGAVTATGNSYYNSAVLILPSGELSPLRYNKIHLVPFGEYIPLKKALRFLETVAPIGDIARGKDYTLFETQNPNTAKSRINPKSQIPNKFSVLICFEDLFPELSRRFINKGARFLVNITNDAWYKNTPAAQQHLQASVLRAVENRVFLVRSANTGISGFISPSGKIISLVGAGKSNIFVSGYRTQEVFGAAENKPGFYSRYGDVFIAGCFLLAIFLYIKEGRFLKQPKSASIGDTFNRD